MIQKHKVFYGSIIVIIVVAFIGVIIMFGKEVDSTDVINIEKQEEKDNTDEYNDIFIPAIKDQETLPKPY
jgi:hypothetical protein